MSFVQPAPQLADPYRDDRVLQSWLARVLPGEMRRAAEADFRALADYALRAYARQVTTTTAEPVLTNFDVWGNRIDRIELTETWREGPTIAATHGLVADGHDRSLGEFARAQQFAKVYLYHAASAFYSCPLAMTDGVATALRDASNATLRERILPHLLSRDPATFWISGQWMTENAGGSDVAGSETIAHQHDDGTWRLSGRKWFTSAINAEIALALARPQGNPAGADGLALFCVETRNADGAWNGITIDRLKDKLGTRELPTAEIHLVDTRAELVGDTAHGVRAIAPVLQVTRLWNAFGSLSTMQRCLALTRDYARARQAFGKPLLEQPLFADSLAGHAAEFEAAFHLAMEVALLLGRVESGVGDERDAALQRLLTPLAKLWICKLGVRIASETVEAFGGIGYLEDSGIPLLLRDAQVFPIWEGASNVQALDFLRALGKLGLAPLLEAIDACLADAGNTDSTSDIENIRTTVRHA
ncbi:MAG TPA: acyl-CoA dehydrogenase family protein, partial [Rhodanobacteraceae bacterium]